jgi:hypothetical protein
VKLVAQIAGGILAAVIIMALIYLLIGDAYRLGMEQGHQICVEDSANRKVT